jgi:hypothetical protein
VPPVVQADAEEHGRLDRRQQLADLHRPVADRELAENVAANLQRRAVGLEGTVLDLLVGIEETNDFHGKRPLEGKGIV